MSLLSSSSSGAEVALHGFGQLPLCFVLLPPKHHHHHHNQNRSTKNYPHLPTLFSRPDIQSQISDNEWKLPTTKATIHYDWKNTRDTTALRNRRRDDQEEEDGVVFAVESIRKGLSSPIPGISPDLAVGYPLALAASIVLSPLSYSVTLIGFFCLFAYLGRTFVLLEEEEDNYHLGVNDDDDDDPQPNTDLLALAGAIVSAGLLAPETIPGITTTTTTTTTATTGDPQYNIIVGVVVACGLGGYVLFSDIVGDRPPAEVEAMDSAKDLEESIMNKWDDKLGQQGDRRDDQRK